MSLLNTQDAVYIAEILRWAKSNARLIWIFDEDVEPIEGVARSLGDEHGNFLGNEDDVRDAYLRISGTFEYFLPVREVMEKMKNGLIGEF